MKRKCFKVLISIMAFLAGYAVAEELAYQKLVPEIVRLMDENEALERKIAGL